MTDSLKRMTFLPKEIYSIIIEYDGRWYITDKGKIMFYIPKNDSRYKIIKDIFFEQYRFFNKIHRFDSIYFEKENMGDVHEININGKIQFFHFHKTVLYPYIDPDNQDFRVNRNSYSIQISSFIHKDCYYSFEDEFKYHMYEDDITNKIGYCCYYDNSKLTDL